MKKKATVATSVILLIVLIDQIVKIWVKTHFYLGEDVEVLPFFHLRFIQNNGMAFGFELGSKLLLTSFRIVLVGLLCLYISKLVKAVHIPLGYIISIAAITAGAFGNIIDCVFYGEIFNNPFPPAVATFQEFGHGYGSIFQGYVVDMLYFPLISFTWPEWMPMVGGNEFTFFDPVFNIADSAITVGMAVLILFYSKYLGPINKTQE